MSFYYRCMSCRTCNTFKRRLEEYKRQKVCRACSHWRFYVDRERQHRTDYCQCENYHFTHRVGSKFCVVNPNHEFNIRTLRYGENQVDVLIDIAWEAVAKIIPVTEEVPF